MSSPRNLPNVDYELHAACLARSPLEALRLGGFWESPSPCQPAFQLDWLMREELILKRFDHFSPQDNNKILGYSIPIHT